MQQYAKPKKTQMPLDFLDPEKILPDQSKSQQVYNQLRDAIVDLKFNPGDAVNKELICETLNISRTPVTEAFARLVEDGLMDVYPQHGSYISKIRISDVHQGSFLRRALELEAVRTVAHNLTPEQAETLKRNLRYQQNCLDAGDLDDLHRLDKGMHHMIAEFTGFPRVSRILESSRGQLDRVRKLFLGDDSERARETLKEHILIVDAIIDHQPEAAVQAMKSHLDKTPAKLELLMRQQPELFDNESS